jgi:hypothetical protein
MDITETSGTWRVTPGQIENRKTGEIRRIANLPSHHTLAVMNERTFVKKCAAAFASGEWR